MTDTLQAPVTGAENVLWDLSIFYQSPSDPAIEADMQRANEAADAFAAQYRGKVASLSAAEMVTAIQALDPIVIGRHAEPPYIWIVYCQSANR